MLIKLAVGIHGVPQATAPLNICIHSTTSRLVYLRPWRALDFDLLTLKLFDRDGLLIR